MSSIGPYIPEAHQKYDILPRSRKEGGEVFSYPAELGVIDQYLGQYESDSITEDGRTTPLLLPYGCKSCDEYYEKLNIYAEKHRERDYDLYEAIQNLIETTKKMNIKEDWSILRYIGEDRGPTFGLTPGRLYYWPCAKEKPMYEGVIDDQEFTSYIYTCDPECWEIIEDPTGMAAVALSGKCDDATSWAENLDGENLFADLVEEGCSVKYERKNFMMDQYDELPWSSTDIDKVEFSCPQCNEKLEMSAWTLVNAKENPEAVDKIVDGSLFEFVCPHCGYDAHLNHPCLYVDPDNLICIYSVVDEEMAARAAEMFNDPENDIAMASKCRIVFGREDLAEKVLILTNEIDDRAIELLKFGVRGSTRLEGLANENEDIVVRLKEIDDTDLVFCIEVGDSAFEASMDIAACDLFLEGLDNSSISDEEVLFVNRQWADYALDVINAEGTMP